MHCIYMYENYFLISIYIYEPNKLQSFMHMEGGLWGKIGLLGAGWWFGRLGEAVSPSFMGSQSFIPTFWDPLFWNKQTTSKFLHLILSSLLSLTLCLSLLPDEPSVTIVRQDLGRVWICRYIHLFRRCHHSGYRQLYILSKALLNETTCHSVVARRDW